MPDQSEVDEALHELILAGAWLNVNVGLFATVVGGWPEEVRGNFIEKVQSVTANLRREMGEFQDFAEAYDG